MIHIFCCVLTPAGRHDDAFRNSVHLQRLKMKMKQSSYLICLFSPFHLVFSPSPRSSDPAPFRPEDEDEDDTGEERLPSCFDYVMHFLTVFWKVLFACVPPTDYLNGWACFFVSIVIIGLLTAVIGDLASHFGCTIGLKDSVTAVVFVALGTSVPGESVDESSLDETFRVPG